MHYRMSSAGSSFETHYYRNSAGNGDDNSPVRCKYCGCLVKSEADAMKLHLKFCGESDRVFLNVLDEW